MSSKVIDGAIYKNMILAAAARLEEQVEDVNALNVFPVPDGDTGTNMSLTLNNAANELNKLESPTLGRALEVTASALLRGARGNSGVITSLLFRGITKSMKDHSTADGVALARALAEGSATAYKAVMKPAEGTILTVSRVAGEAAVKASKKHKDAESVLAAALKAAQHALDETTEQNPVLKKAGVVDAGGYGYVIILQAMLDVVSGTITRIVRKVAAHPVKIEAADFSQFDTEEITFAYCTEFIAKREDASRDPQLLRDFLETIGDCVVVVEDDEIIKVHVHTDTPDKALGEGMKYGHLLTVKVENMLEQHDRKVADEQAAAMTRVKVAEPEKRYGFVSVAAGEGIVSLFRDLGADQIVEGGQTMNPSTEDILGAIDATPAEVVFVLPNNKNIIMASEQAAQLASKQVVVLPTKTIPQGISAMLAFDPEIDPENNAQTMGVAAQLVHSGQMTYAARDSEFDGNPIKQGDYLALCEGKLHATGPDFFETMQQLAEGMCSNDAAFITILYGEGADEEQAQKVSEMFQAAAPNAEINVLEGGQPVYSYILSVE